MARGNLRKQTGQEVVATWVAPRATTAQSTRNTWISTSTHRGESRPMLSLRNVPRLYIKKIILITCDT